MIKAWGLSKAPGQIIWWAKRNPTGAPPPPALPVATQLSEKTRILIQNQIQANIVQELSNIRTDRNDSTLNVEPPLSYFIFDGARTYQCPAIFIVVDSGEVLDWTTRSNSVAVKMKIYVSAVIEGLEANSLTIKCERYQAALFKILHQTHLQDQTKNTRIYIECKRFQFSRLYTKSQRGENMGEFNKEVSIELEVLHWENPIS